MEKKYIYVGDKTGEVMGFISRFIKKRKLLKERKELLYLIKEHKGMIFNITRDNFCGESSPVTSKMIESLKADITYHEGRIEEITNELSKETP